MIVEFTKIFGGLVILMIVSSSSFAQQNRPHVPIPGGLQGKTCYECHMKGDGINLPSAEKPRKYSLSVAFGTYQKSVHGRLRALGDRNAPLCEDCHLTREWSAILSREHPDSPVHPDNLGKICAKCHGPAMLTARVSEGSQHLDLLKRPFVGSPAAARMVGIPGVTKTEEWYYFEGFDFIAIIHYGIVLFSVGLLSAMSFYMVLDLIHELRSHRRKPKPVKADKTSTRPEQYKRFSYMFVIQHFLLFTSMLALIFTGVPLKFPNTDVAQFFVNMFGGMETRATIHHTAGFTLLGVGAFHFIYYVFFYWKVPFFKQPILMQPKDVLEIFQHLGYLLGLRKEMPKFGRFTWYEKFEYSGLVGGFVVMGGTGLTMYFMEFSLNYAPMSWIQTVWATHGQWAIMDSLFLLIIHMYHVHYSPAKFPMSMTWLTGKISKEEMETFHPLELEEIEKAQKSEKGE